MKQLKMSRDAALPVGEILLPDGYSFSQYRGREDIPGWCECCRKGLIEDTDGEETFLREIANKAGLCPEQDTFFLDINGEHVGTVSAYLRSDGLGGVHMVAIREDCRGRGLCSPMIKMAILHLQNLGAETIVLTTDEERRAAIRAYIKEGFRPVEYDIGMQSRWENVLEDLGIESAEMVYLDSTHFRTIFRKKNAQQ